jgi:hypothetical protein
MADSGRDQTYSPDEERDLRSAIEAQIMQQGEEVNPFATAPANINEYYGRQQGMRAFERADPYAGALAQVSRKSAASQKRFTPNTPDWQRGMIAAGAQRFAAANPDKGLSLKPEWAARGADFQGRVPLDALQKMGHAMAKAKNMQRNMQLLQVAMIAAGGVTAGATQGLSAGAQAAIAGGAGASNAAITGGIQGNIDPKNIAIAGATGAAGAGLAGSGMNPVVGGAASGGMNALARGFSTGQWDPADAAFAVGSGAGSGALTQAGVPSWAIAGARPWVNAGYSQARGRPTDPIATGIQSASGAGTEVLNKSVRPTAARAGGPPWADPSRARYINPQG